MRFSLLSQKLRRYALRAAAYLTAVCLMLCVAAAPSYARGSHDTIYQGSAADNVQKYYDAGSIPLFSACFTQLTPDEQEEWIERLCRLENVTFLSAAMHSMNMGEKTASAWAQKAYDEGHLSCLSVFADNAGKSELQSLFNRALADGRWAFGSVLAGNLDCTDKFDALEDEHNKQFAQAQDEEYRAAGITRSGKDWLYNGQLIHVFLDVRANGSFYTLDVNPKGEINVRVIRGADGAIEGVREMSEAEVSEILNDLADDEDDDYAAESSVVVPIRIEHMAAGQTVWLGEFDLTEGDAVQYSVRAEQGPGLEIGFAKQKDASHGTSYYCVHNMRLEDENLLCEASFQCGPPAPSGKYDLFVCAEDGAVSGVSGSVSILRAESSVEASFEYETDDEGGICITGYKGKVPAELVVPAEIDDLPVTAIGDWAFDYEDELKFVSLPESLERIGNSAFRNCEYLDTVQIAPTKLTQIGGYAFAFCDELRHVSLPATLRTLGESAFWHCSNLASVSVPEGVDELADGVFGYCASLKAIDIPDTVVRVGTMALAGTGLTEIALPVSVRELGDSSFAESPDLVSLKIPGPVKEIPSGMATDCPSLKTAILPIGARSIGAEAFSHCESLEQINIPLSVREIGQTAFWACSSLESVVIPEGVEVIPFGAFWNCSVLQTVGIPKSVAEIGPMAFYGAPLRDVYYSGGESDWNNIVIAKEGEDQFGAVSTNSNESLERADMYFNTTVPVMPNGVSLIFGSQLHVAESALGPVLLGYTAASPGEARTVSDITDQFVVPEGAWWSVRSADGTAKMPEDTCGTGDVLALQNMVPAGFSVTVVLSGDVTGSGVLNLTQVVRIAKAYSGAAPLEGAFLLAGDFTGSGSIQLTDVVREAELYMSQQSAL